MRTMTAKPFQRVTQMQSDNVVSEYFKSINQFKSNRSFSFNFVRRDSNCSWKNFLVETFAICILIFCTVFFLFFLFVFLPAHTQLISQSQSNCSFVATFFLSNYYCSTAEHEKKKPQSSLRVTNNGIGNGNWALQSALWLVPCVLLQYQKRILEFCI